MIYSDNIPAPATPDAIVLNQLTYTDLLLVDPDDDNGYCVYALQGSDKDHPVLVKTKVSSTIAKKTGVPTFRANIRLDFWLTADDEAGTVVYTPAYVTASINLESQSTIRAEQSAIDAMGTMLSLWFLTSPSNIMGTECMSKFAYNSALLYPQS